MAAAATKASSGAPAGGGGVAASGDRLSAVAALLPAVLTGAASSSALPASTSVAELQASVSCSLQLLLLAWHATLLRFGCVGLPALGWLCWLSVHLHSLIVIES
jgi:hypothetical protein